MFRLSILPPVMAILMIVMGISTESRQSLPFNSTYAVIPTATPDSTCPKCRRPTSDGTELLNEPPDVTDVTLDKTELKLPCGSADKQSPTPLKPSDALVTVKTSAKDPENDVLTYNYTVSGGRVVGTGANVIWNLERVQPGTYVMVVGVDDGCGVCGKTVTKVVSVVCSTS